MQEPVPGHELARARNLEALSYPGDFETTSDMAGKLATLVVYGLPESFFAEYVPKIESVSAAAVQQAARQYLPVDRFAVVVVGDLSQIEQPIRAANFGPVTVVAVDDVMR
jgi:zinc protease